MKRVKAFLGITILLGVILAKYNRLLVATDFLGMDSFGMYLVCILLVVSINATMFSLFSGDVWKSSHVD